VEFDSVTLKGLLAGVIFLAVILYYIWSKVRAPFERKKAKARAEALRAEAAAFFQRNADGIPAIETNLILGGDEHALLADQATLFESRAHRVYGGAGTSIQGLRLGAGASESRDSIRRIDDGTLTLTTSRLIFDGTRENRSIKLKDLLSVEVLLDAIEVSIEKRQKSVIFALPNPLIWGPVIKGAAKSARQRS
jgi:hypothetical protein